MSGPDEHTRDAIDVVETCAYELSVRTHEDPAELCGEIVAPGCGPYCERHAEVAL